MAEPSVNPKDIFLDALEVKGAEREALVRERCGGDESLRAQVEGLIEAHEGGSTLFGEVEPVPVASSEFEPGSRVGSHRLVEEIGRGGFAVVWRAEQLEPVRRPVALKVLRASMDTREVVARFNAERQALALMDHPCIARVFDGGVTDSGRPWFAMELVDGVPVTEYCANKNLSIAARLKLFTEMCRAVQHAHQKGVIHRDLKPSNVLVAEVDGSPVPKIIDFGIAKAVEQKLTEDSIQTMAGQIVGTPAYMSPEQADDSLDIDTRCDVYALGALLYEILSGARPFEDRTLEAAGLIEVLRIIKEVDPPRPSTRLTGSTSILSKELRGDLDWIVMRCLEKDRDRRYDSAGILANEIERHLAGEPVLAGPPEFSYRMHKFVRRHQLALGAAAAVVALLIVGIVVSSALLFRALRAEDDLSDEVIAKEVELGKFQSIAYFFEEILVGLDPAVAQGADTTLLKKLLRDATDRVEANSGGVLEVEATLRRVIGNAYQRIALFDEAEEQLRLACEIRGRILPDKHEDLAVSRLELGSFYLRMGLLEDAEPLLRSALEIRESNFGSGALETLEPKSNVAILYRHLGRPEEAEPLLLEVESARIADKGERNADSIRAMNNVASLHEDLGRYEEALERFERAAELQLEVQGPRHPETAKAYNNLGGILVEMGREERAIPYLEQALGWKREILSDGDRSLIVGLNSLARVYRSVERAEEAEALYLEAMEMLARTGTEETSHGVLLRFNYSTHLTHLERGEEAEALLERGAEIAVETFGEESKLSLLLEGGLGWQIHLNGRSAQAVALLRSVLERAEDSLAEGHPDFGMHRVRLGAALVALGQAEEGRPLLESGLELSRAANLAPWIEVAETTLASLGDQGGD